MATRCPHGAVLSETQDVFMAWSLVKHKGQLYLYLYLIRQLLAISNFKRNAIKFTVYSLRKNKLKGEQ